MRTRLSLAALAVAIVILGIRIREINAPPAPVQLAPRTLHVLYLDSLRHELLTFAEQYGRPVFQYDTTSPVTGHGRVQLTRLRNALFDPRIEYSFGDQGFSLDWRGDPKPRIHSNEFRRLGSGGTVTFPYAWPVSAAAYARLRRLFVTPQWPDVVSQRVNRPRQSPVPPHGDAYASSLSLPTTHYPLTTPH